MGVCLFHLITPSYTCMHTLAFAFRRRSAILLLLPPLIPMDRIGGADARGDVQGRHAESAAEPAEGGGPTAGAGAQDSGGGWVCCVEDGEGGWVLVGVGRVGGGGGTNGCVWMDMTGVSCLSFFIYATPIPLTNERLGDLRQGHEGRLPHRAGRGGGGAWYVRGLAWLHACMRGAFTGIRTRLVACSAMSPYLRIGFTFIH